MPIYEYWCYTCQRKVSLLLPVSSQVTPSCPQCGSNTLHRLFSTFSVRKTYKDIYEDILTDSQLTKGMMSNDPKALAEWNRRISQGEPVAPEYQDMLERMERGEMPQTRPFAATTSESESDEG
jgi:putative FmdB family regulatory protein